VNKDKSRTIAVLQNYGGLGRFGLASDAPYLRTESLSTLVHADNIKQSGVLHFKMYREGDDFNTAYRECVAPNGTTAFGVDFSFSLVFWELPHPAPSRSVSTFDFFKVFLRSMDRTSGTVADAIIPLKLSTNGSMGVGRWCVAIDSVSLVYHGVASTDLSAAILVTSDTINPGVNNNRILGMLGRSFRTNEENFFGLRLTTKPCTRDHIGYELKGDELDSLAEFHIGMRKESGATLTSPSLLRNWSMTLVFYRVYH
jgi:hypothetical protein